VPPTGQGLHARIGLGCLAVPAGVVVRDFLAAGFEFADDGVQATPAQ
jgi:hypothetical protein